MSEEALNNIVIDSSGFSCGLRLVISTLSSFFFWAGNNGSTLEEVTLKPSGCAGLILQRP